MNVSTRFRIVGWEVVGLAGFLLLLLVLQWGQAPNDPVVGSFLWVYAIVGITLLLVGLETVALVRQLPK